MEFSESDDRTLTSSESNIQSALREKQKTDAQKRKNKKKYKRSKKPDRSEEYSVDWSASTPIDHHQSQSVTTTPGQSRLIQSRSTATQAQSSISALTPEEEELERRRRQRNQVISPETRSKLMTVIPIVAGGDFFDPNVGGQTPLIVSSFKGHLPIVNCLISAGAHLFMVDREGNSAFHAAVECGNLEIVKQLHRSGYNEPDKLNMANAKGYTPFYGSVNNDRLDIASFLYESGADVNKADNNGITPLHVATAQGNKRMVRFLLAKGADCNKQSHLRLTPLDLSCMTTNGKVTQILKRVGRCIPRLSITWQEIIGCFNCRSQRNLKRCGGCIKLWYCSAKCQKEDRKRHKPRCLKCPAHLGLQQVSDASPGAADLRTETRRTRVSA